MTKKKAIDQKWTAHSPSQIPNNIKVKYVCAITQTLILNCFQETRHESNTAKWTTSQETGILQQVNIDVIHLNVKNSMKPMGFPGLRPGAEHFCLLTPASMRSREWTHWYVWYVQRICHMYDIHISYIYIYTYTKIWNDPLRRYVMVEEHLLTVKSLNIDFWWLLTTLGRSSCATSPLTNTIDRVQHSAEKLLINGEHRNLKVEESIYIYIWGKIWNK